jgi:hypothetical protein
MPKTRLFNKTSGVGVGMGVEDLEEKWVRGVESGEKGSKVVT